MSTSPMASTIILSSFENTSTDSFRIAKRFPTPYTSKYDEIGLQSVSLYNSWFNITPTFNNQSCSYIWTDGTTNIVTLTPGSYTLDNISEYIQFVMTQNKHYLIDNNGNSVFYLRMEVNPVYYSVVLTLTPLPTTLPSGWSLPSGVSWTLGNGQTPRFVTNASNFNKLIGFAASTTFPASVQTTAQQFNSTLTPIISPITAVNLACNWVNDNRFNSMPNIIGSFIPDNSTGNLISYTPPILSMYPVTQNQYSGIEVSFLDQEFRPLILNDVNQIQIMLALKTHFN